MLSAVDGPTPWPTSSERPSSLRLHEPTSTGPFAEAVSTLLATARTHLDLDAAFISEWEDGRQFVRFVDGDYGAFGLGLGELSPLGTDYCPRVVAGSLPGVVGDAQADARTCDLDSTKRLDLGAYVGVPLRFSDGRILGMLVALGKRAAPGLEARDRRFLDAFGAAVAVQLERRSFERSASRARAGRVRAALEPGAFQMVFQPVAELATGRVVGAEALARFPLEPLRGPDAWFAEAWELGCGVELELAAVARALDGLPALPEGAFLAINVAPRTLLSPGLARVLGAGSLARVVLEVTEHASVDDYGAIEEALAPLRARGARLAVDDAGAGFASFQHILRLRPDFIKLDLNLTRDLDLDAARRALVAALVSFSFEVGATVLAEGIERREEFVTLRRLGVMLGQGYYLGRPAITPVHDEIEVDGLEDWPATLAEERAMARARAGRGRALDESVLRALRDPGRLHAVRGTSLFDTPPDEVFDRLTALASTLLGAPVAMVSLLDDRRQFVKSAIGLGEPWATKREVPIAHSICAHTIATGATLELEDIRTHPVIGQDRVLDSIGVRAYLGIPLVVGRYPVGTLCVLDTAPRNWAGAEVALLEHLADSAVTEIELRASLREIEDARKVLDRTHASVQGHLAKQEESERRFRELVEASVEAVLVNEGGKIVGANRAAAELFGYEPEAMVGLSGMDLIHPAARDVWGTYLGENAETDYETIGLRRDGSTFVMSVGGQNIAFRGRVARVSTVRHQRIRRPPGRARETLPYTLKKL